MSSGLVRLYRKARGRDPRYLAWKAADRVSKKARRYLLVLDRAPDTAALARAVAPPAGKDLRRHLAERGRPRFHITQGEVDELLLSLASRDPQYARRLAARAESVLLHRLPVLGVGEMWLGERIDWHRDYRSGLRWEQRYSFDYDLYGLDLPSDVRITWELNRLHFLADLGKAYRLTRDERYARMCVELISDWDRENPYCRSINWTCAMDAAIRAVNIIWAVTLLLPSPHLDDAFLGSILRLLVRHGRFIRQNMEYADVRSNHYVSDLVGLVYLGVFLDGAAESKAWLDYAVPRLDAEIVHQSYDDGVSHEGSIPYHRLAAELFASAALLLRINGIELSRRFYERLEKMIGFTSAYVKPDGSCPMFGDCDDGRLQVLGEQHVNDHRYLLALGAVLFGRPDFKGRAAQFWEEAAWLTGPRGWAEFERLGPDTGVPGSEEFPAGGFYIVRSADDYAAIDCGDVGMRGRGGHGHCDVLSFELSLGGENIVADRGCFLYTASRQRRREVLRAASHNAIILDGVDFCRLNDYDIASASNTPHRAISWRPEAGEFTGEHAGYAESGVIHRRSLVLAPGAHRAEVTDSLLGSGEHDIVSRFFLAEGCVPVVDGQACSIATPRGRSVRLTAYSEASFTWAIRESTLFPRYGVEVPTRVVELQATALLPVTFKLAWQLECKG